MRPFHVYLLTNKLNGTLYIGVTNDLKRRVFEHKQHLVKGFTQKYKFNKLVYLEEYEDVKEAIAREKQLKKWHRAWKIKLVEEQNRNWIDLYDLVE